MQPVVVEEPSISGWAIAFFILLFLIIIIIIAFFFFWGTPVNRTITLGGACNDTNQCVDGLTCENATCKIQLGGQCDHVSDCVSAATACFNNICVNTPLSDVGNPPPCKAGLVNDHGICKVKMGGTCKKHCDCASGMECYDNKCEKIRHHRDYSSNSNSSNSSECVYSSNNSNHSNKSNDSKTSRWSSSNNNKNNSNRTTPVKKTVIKEESQYHTNYVDKDDIGSMYQQIKRKNKYNIVL